MNNVDYKIVLNGTFPENLLTDKRENYRIACEFKNALKTYKLSNTEGKNLMNWLEKIHPIPCTVVWASLLGNTNLHNLFIVYKYNPMLMVNFLENSNSNEDLCVFREWMETGSKHTCVDQKGIVNKFTVKEEKDEFLRKHGFMTKIINLF